MFQCVLTPAPVNFSDGEDSSKPTIDPNTLFPGITASSSIRINNNGGSSNGSAKSNASGGGGARRPPLIRSPTKEDKPFPPTHTYTPTPEEEQQQLLIRSVVIWGIRFTKYST